MRKALVCAAGGFIGGHLVKKLKREGYWARGVDIKHHEFAQPQISQMTQMERQESAKSVQSVVMQSVVDEFLLADLREPQNCQAALTLDDGTFDEVYQLAADMAGMGSQTAADSEFRIASCGLGGWV